MQFRKEWVIPTAVGVGSFIVGGVSGYIFAHFKPFKTLKEIQEDIEIKQKDLIALQRMTHVSKMKLLEYEERLEAVKQEANEDQLQLDLDHKEEDDEVIIIERETKFSEIESKKQAVMAHIDNGEEESMVNVFRRPVDENWDWDEEMEKRKHSPIYIIHRDEYENEEKAEDGYTQSTVTYYRGDGILCDESDVPIYEAKNVVGNLEFGRGSGDPNVCYVRNENLTSEYEVLLEEGWFGHEVLGQHLQDLIEQSKQNTKLEHSVPKFRPE